MHSTCLAQAQLYVTPKLTMSTRCFYSAFDTLAINSPLGHFNGDNAYSPPQKYQTHETTRCQSSIPPTATWLSLNYSEHNPSHVRRHTLPSQPSQLLITQFRLNTHNLSTRLAAQKANPIFHAANKNHL